MGRRGVDCATITQTAYALAEKRGLAALDIRGVAEACGVSVGTIYNCFPTKDDLMVEVIGTFWGNVFQEDLCRVVPGERFDAFVVRLHSALTSGLAAFRSDWLPQISALSMQGRDAGKLRETELFNHMRAGLQAVLAADPDADVARAGVSAEELVAFVLDSLIHTLSAGEGDCRVLAHLLSAALYEAPAHTEGAHVAPEQQSESTARAAKEVE